MKWRSSIPVHLVATALLFAIGYAVVWLLGWREYTTILSGTLVSGSQSLDGLRAASYLLMHLGSVVFAPICVIAAGVLVVLERLLLQPTDTPASG